MADSFTDLGLRPEVAEAARSAGYTTATGLQRAAIPVLRRGGNAVLHASTGAGVVAAYGLPLLDRLLEVEGDDPATGPRALVLAPTADEAGRIAAMLARLASTTGLRVRARGPGWARATGAHIEVLGAADAVTSLNKSELKVDAVQSLVIDGLSAIRNLHGSDALDTLMTALPREAQRIVVTSELNRDTDQFAEQFVRRALSIPPRAADPAETMPVPIQSTVAYAVVAEADKGSCAAEMIADTSDTPVVYCRTDERAAEVAEALTIRGFNVGVVDDEETDVAIAAPGEALSGGWNLSYDVPFDADTLRTRHASGGVVLVTARELPHLRRIAAEANFGLRPLASTERNVSGAIAEFRERLRAALREEDLEAQSLLLQPLLEEHSAVEIAAAASALLRKKLPPAARTNGAAAASAPKAYVRLFIALGERDGVRPGDLVGAIAGEAGVAGDQVGRIEIRDNFSVVEVPSDVAERVIKSLNGTTMKGRSVRVDYDRRTNQPEGGRGGQAPRAKGGRGAPRGDRPPRGDGPPRGDRAPRGDRMRRP